MLLLMASIGAAPDPGPVSSKRDASQTTDFSRQLIVLGANAAVRSPFTSSAQQLRQRALEILHQAAARYPVARPILIVIHPASETGRSILGAPAVIEDPAGLKFQIQVSELESAEGRPFRRVFLTALLLELGHRANPNSPPESPPRWLVDALLDRLSSESPLEHSVLLRPLLDAGKVPALKEVLSRRENDPRPSSREDAAVARCLLNLLRERPEARQGFLGLLEGENKTEPQVAELLRHFPSLARSETELQRVWTLHLASQATQRERIRLNGLQTVAELRRLLEISASDPSGKPRVFNLEQFSEFVRLPGVKEILAARHLEFLALLGRGHFYFTEPLEIYAEVCRQLSLGVTQGQAAQLRRAREITQSASNDLEKIRDVLNWVEVERAQGPNPLVEEIYRLWESTPELPKNPFVSQALDEVEARLKRRAAEADVKRALDEAAARSSRKADPERAAPGETQPQGGGMPKSR